MTEEEARFYQPRWWLHCYAYKKCDASDIPDNIMLDREGHIKLMDFGLATTRRENLVLVCGTPEYVPPEVLHLRVGAHTLDRYALGVLIYRMLYGCTPFDDENARNVFLTS